MSKSNKPSKRHKIICIKCGAEQSTYSTNRVQCHTCKAPCGERHTFPLQDARRALIKKEAEKASAES